MAYLSGPYGLLRDLWPTALPRLNNDQRCYALLSDKEKVPGSREQIPLWATVQRNRLPFDTTRRLVLLLMEIPPAVAHQQIAVNVQGFVCGANLALRTLGNWHGRLDNARNARQTLTLCSGGHSAPFTAQAKALQQIIDYIRSEAGDATKHGVDRGRLQLERPVFRRAKENGHKAIQLTAFDDPMGHARKVAEQWVIIDRLELGVQSEGYQTTRSSAMAIQASDFVQATILFDISNPGVSSKKCIVRFWMTRVIRLARPQKSTKHGKGLTQKGKATEMRNLGDGFQWGPEPEDVDI
ncbi:hypothetical protein QCA50_019349 [Cerrena zonata]|uniref:Uncharacterized protein n=1 Tax=Cerrena zonata TaxID=2478898 RepID=A0AAW0FJ70_9APHY